MHSLLCVNLKAYTLQVLFGMKSLLPISGPAFGTVKGQVSVFSTVFQRLLASHSLFRTVVAHVALSICFPLTLVLWDLNLVLTALQNLQFEPI